MGGELVEGLGDGAGDAAGGFAADGALGPQEAGDGLGALKNEGGEGGKLARGEGGLGL